MLKLKIDFQRQFYGWFRFSERIVIYIWIYRKLQNYRDRWILDRLAFCTQHTMNLRRSLNSKYVLRLYDNLNLKNTAIN